MMSEGSDRSVELDDLEAMEYACMCLLEKDGVGVGRSIHPWWLGVDLCTIVVVDA